MPDEQEKTVVPTILANIRDAQRNVSQKDIDQKHHEEKVDLLTNIRSAIKLSGKRDEKLNRTKENDEKKRLKMSLNLLSGIFENTKQNIKEFGIFKTILIVVAGLILFAAEKIRDAAILAFRGLKKLTVGLANFISKKLFGVEFRKTRLGKSLFNIVGNIRTFFVNIGKSVKEEKGIFKFLGFVKKVFRTVGNFLKTGFTGIMKGVDFVFDLFARFGRMISGITKFFPIIKSVAKAIPGIGQSIAVIFGIFDGIRGFFKAAEFFNKKEGEAVTIGERLSAVIGSIISGLTFGLFGDSKEWATGIFKLFTEPVKFLKENVFGEGGVLSGLVDGIYNIVTWLPKMLAKGVDKVLGLFGIDSNFFGFVDGMFNFTKNILDNIVQSVKNIFGKLFQEDQSMVSNIIDFLFSPIEEMFKLVWKGISGIFGMVGLDGISDVMDSVGDFISNFWNQYKEVPKMIWNFVVDSFKGIFVSDETESSLLTRMMGTVKEYWNGFKDLPGKILNFVVDSFKTIFSFSSGFDFGFISNTISDFFGKMIGKIKDSFLGTLENMGDFFSWVSSWAINSVKKLFSNVGKVFNETISQLPDMLSWVAQFASDLIGTVVSTLKEKFLGALTSLPGFLKDIFKNSQEDERTVQDKSARSKPVQEPKQAMSLSKTGIVNIKQLKPEDQEIVRRKILEEQETGLRPRLKESEAIPPDRAISIGKDLTDQEKTKLWFDFLMNDFSDVMASKIHKGLKPDTKLISPTPVIIN